MAEVPVVSVADWRTLCRELRRQERAAALAGALHHCSSSRNLGECAGLASLLPARETPWKKPGPGKGQRQPPRHRLCPPLRCPLPRPLPLTPLPLPLPSCPPAIGAGDLIEEQRLMLDGQVVIAGHLTATTRAQLAEARQSESAAPGEVEELEEELSIHAGSLEMLAAAARAAGQL